MATRKLPGPTVKRTIRLFSEDVDRAKRLMPRHGIAGILRIIFHNHMLAMEKAEAARLAEMVAELEITDE